MFSFYVWKISVPSMQRQNDQTKPNNSDCFCTGQLKFTWNLDERFKSKSVTIVECRDHCAKSPESALVLSLAALIVMDQIKQPKQDRFYFSCFFSLNNLTSVAMSHYWYSAYFSHNTEICAYTYTNGFLFETFIWQNWVFDLPLLNLSFTRVE